MSRAFVKESDGDGPDELPELPLSPHPNYVTARGLALLQRRLAGVEQQLLALPSTAVDSRLARAELAREQRWLQARLGSARLVNTRAANVLAGADSQRDVRVDFGAKVELIDDNGQRYQYRIVGEDEADPEQGRISWLSPLARALKGAQVGDSVRWSRPAGDREIELLAIDFRPDAVTD
ncbi:transcription elongation factor GreAB [Permianibacter sp. IMCC34836]|uniref:GreA/GreB family elongation factor n=1 Tax=Permianibacter fluminis TaxID=2738515 RepID=UPI0015518407|nr:GreA/GreB family elongation factor [Permianibacter fluminis]NQD38464.1 transcription elongation factor GreAB [Permianibacter fluminis]